MAKNTVEIPYTELVERTMELSRSPVNAITKVRGIIQDIYTREIPTKFDWSFLIAQSSLTTTGEYKTGTISATTGSSTATLSSDATITAAFTGRRVKVTGNDVVYDVTFSNSTAVTLNPGFQGSANASAASYSIFAPFYTLACQFDRFLKDGGVDKWVGGKRETIYEKQYHEFMTRTTPTPSTPEVLRLYGTDSLGRPVIEFAPPPKDARNYAYTYLRKLNPMIETTAGLVTIGAGDTTVTGNTSCRFTEATTGDWLRIDALGTGQDSSWYRISAISHNSSLTLATAFANTGVTTTNYTISRAPEMPSRMHIGILYGSLRTILMDQSDENALVYNVQYAEVLSDGKRIYTARPYSKQVENIAEDYDYRR